MNNTSERIFSIPLVFPNRWLSSLVSTNSHMTINKNMIYGVGMVNNSAIDVLFSRQEFNWNISVFPFIIGY